MTALGIDLGGTKLAAAVFNENGEIIFQQSAVLNKRSGKEVGALVRSLLLEVLALHPSVQAIGVIVPGIYREPSGTVWAPNIEGWDDYPLLKELQQVTDLPLIIDSDRAGYILGELWMGNAKGCSHAIYMAVGTGIGAGILIEGKVLRGAHDIAGAIGWMALKPPFDSKYEACGCFEYHASGEGITRLAKDVLNEEQEYNGYLRQISPENITTKDVFTAFDANDPVAEKVLHTCIQMWGMAVANLVSLFNPEKIIIGGGVFGPATGFINDIAAEAAKWAQPLSMKKVKVEQSALGADAGLYGAGFMAWKQVAVSVG